MLHRSLLTTTLLLLLALFSTTTHAEGMDIEDVDYEIWDLMDASVAQFGPGKTWYDLFGVAPDAEPAVMGRAYRKLSLQFHPDKNSAPDAAEKFQVLASTYAILRADEKRRRYDIWMDRGIPFWRGRRYYFRKSENLTIAQSVLVMLSIFSAMQ